MKTKIFTFMILLAILLSACGADMNAPLGASTPTTGPTLPPTAIPPTAIPPTAIPPTAIPPTAIPPTAVPVLPDGIPLIDNSQIIGFFFGVPFFDGPDKPIMVPEGGYSILALCSGNAPIVGTLPCDEKTGNVILYHGKATDGSTPADLNTISSLSGYTKGAVGLTVIWTGSSDHAEKAGNDATSNMMSAPNCGQNGCKLINYYDVAADGTWTVTNYRVENGQLVKQ